MKRIWISGAVAACLLVGCAKTEPLSSTSGPPQTGDASQVSTAGSPQSAPGDTALAPPHENQPSETGARETGAAAGSADASTESGQASSAAVDGSDELLAGIENARLKRAYTSIREQLAKDPTDAGAQLQYVNVLQLLGQERIRSDELEKGYRTFAASAEAARKLLASKAELPPVARDLFAGVFYNDACVAGRGKETKKAVGALDEAVANGFNDFAMLESDDDLAVIRELPDFSQKLEGWKKSAQEALLRKAREDLVAGESFPFDFALQDVTGKEVKLADYRGKVVIVDLWGTWCPPCREEIPSFVKLQSTYGDKGFQMIGLNQESEAPEEAAKKVQSFIAENGMNYPCALLDEATTNQVPELEGFPTTLFIDRTGKVRLKVVGLHEYSYLEAVVQILLAEPAA